MNICYIQALTKRDHKMLIKSITGVRSVVMFLHQPAMIGSNHGCIIRTGYSVGGRAQFIPVKVSQWRMKPRKPLPAVKKLPG